jgi:hypothetical protein
MAVKRSLLDRLERIQNSGMRFILGKERRFSTTIMRRELGWMKLEEKCKSHYASMIWQSIHGRAPIYMREMLHQTSEVHQYALRP